MGWTSCTVFANNVKDAFTKELIPFKYYVDDSYKELKESEIIRLEFNGNNAFVLEKFNNKYFATSYFLSYSKRTHEFAYKDVSFCGSGNSYLASKTMIDLVKKHCSTSPYFDETIKGWDSYHKQQEEIKDKRKNLKVGDVVIFPKCNYGDRGSNYKWTVTSIVNNKVYFNGCHLRNWKKQYFEIVA